jgi:hypothetical protein
MHVQLAARRGNRHEQRNESNSCNLRPAFRIVDGEPAMSIVPHFRITGILAIAVSLIFMVWATMFVQRRRGGLILILLSLILLLVGGGFGPPLLGLILGIAATRIHAPLRWWHAHLSHDSRRAASQAWPWLLVAGVVAWLLVMPGSIVIDYVLGLTISDLAMFALIFSAFGLLLLTIVTGLADDAHQQASVRRAPALRG